jgi:hypothetical protein
MNDTDQPTPEHTTRPTKPSGVPDDAERDRATPKSPDAGAHRKETDAEAAEREQQRQLETGEENPVS